MSQLPEIAQRMLDPKAYPDNDNVSRVEMMQTQMSFVFLTDEFVYKIKKPVDLGFVDYTTLEKRHFYYQREVELNQRLCPQTYLGVVPIILKKNSIQIDHHGDAIEYAVKMRRLPQEAMMNVLLEKDGVSLEMLTRVAEKLAAFHRTADTNDEINFFGSLDTINQNTDENFNQTIKYIGNTISQERYRNIKSFTTGFIAGNTSLFNKRITDGKIRDCHGDLHAAHICFADDILIYDCIEFNDRFRYCDIASEIAFLSMDLDNYDRSDLSHGFIDAYVSFSLDTDLRQLLDFYKCYRAYVRGKVESFKLDDPHISADEKTKTLSIASKYFELAESYIVPS